MAVHKSLHTYDIQKPFMGWFLAIVEYKMIDYIRSLKKHGSHLDLDAVSGFLLELQNDSDLKLDLERALNKLDLKEQRVLTLLKVQGQSVSEVAKKLSLTESNVKVIAHRAYNNLRIYLGTNL